MPEGSQIIGSSESGGLNTVLDHFATLTYSDFYNQSGSWCLFSILLPSKWFLIGLKMRYFKCHLTVCIHLVWSQYHSVFNLGIGYSFYPLSILWIIKYGNHLLCLWSGFKTKWHWSHMYERFLLSPFLYFSQSPTLPRIPLNLHNLPRPFLHVW